MKCYIFHTSDLSLSVCPTEIKFTQISSRIRDHRQGISTYCVWVLLFFFVFTSDAGLLARSQYPEGPATNHLDTGFSWFPCA